MVYLKLLNLTPPPSSFAGHCDWLDGRRWCQWTKRQSSPMRRPSDSAPSSPLPSAYQSSRSWLNPSPSSGLKMASSRLTTASRPFRRDLLLHRLSESGIGVTPWAWASRGWPSADAAPTATVCQSLCYRVTSCWAGTSLTRWTWTRCWTRK